jgi:hypothetical protein
MITPLSGSVLRPRLSIDPALSLATHNHQKAAERVFKREVKAVAT